MYEVKYVMKNRVYFVDFSLQNRVYFFRVYFFRVYFFEFIFLGPSLFFKKPSLFFWNRVYFKKNRVYFQKMLWKINSLLRPSLKNKLRVYFKNKLAPSTFENFEINSICLKINLENKLFSEGLGNLASAHFLGFGSGRSCTWRLVRTPNGEFAVREVCVRCAN